MIKRITLVIIVTICLVSFFLISYQAKGLIKFSKINLSPLISPVNYVTNFASDLLHCQEENKKLKEQLYQIILQQKSSYELMEENRRLKSLLGLKEREKQILTLATIIKRGSNKFLKTFWIDKGSEHGIKTRNASNYIKWTGWKGYIYIFKFIRSTRIN